MVLNAGQLADVAEFLRKLTDATNKHGVVVAPHGPTELRIAGTAISFTWDGEQYVLDDQIGS